MNPTDTSDGAYYPTSQPYQSTPPRSTPPEWTPREGGLRAAPLPTGAKPTPANILRTAKRATLAGTAPENFCVVPARLDYWGNNQHGVCVTSEEAFGEACFLPEVFIPADVVIGWARKRNVLNGATLEEVLSAMQGDGFQIGAQRYDNGPAVVIDYKNEEQLKMALTKGPVKIAIDSRALPPAAGDEQGWFKTGGKPNQFRNTDHCVGLSGYGSAEYLYRQLGVPRPPTLSADARGYLLFTWSTLGFVDHAWLLSTCTEAWLREPTTVGVPPLPGPGPGPFPPGPGPGPGDIFLEGYMEALGQHFPVKLAGTLRQSFTNVGAPNFFVLLMDALAIFRAISTRDIPGLVAAIQKLMADLGLSLSPEERDVVVQGITQALPR